MQAHSESKSALEARAAERRQTSLLLAFRELDVRRSGRLPQDVVTAVCKELNHYREIAHIGDARAALLFAALDRSGDGWISGDEFTRLCELLKVRFQRVPRRSWFEVVAPSLAESRCWRCVRGLVRSGTFDSGIDALLLVAGATLVLEEGDFLAGGAPEDFDSRPDSLWNVLELVFSATFLLEMILKMAVRTI